MQAQPIKFPTKPLPTGVDYAITGASRFNDGVMTTAITANGQAALRTTHLQSRVDIYRNLNKPGLFSCRAREGIYKGKVTGYANIFIVLNPTFVVSSASRRRAITQRKRNVHAYVRSECLLDAFNGSLDTTQLPDAEVITYQPFVRPDFFNRDTQASKYTHEGIALLAGANVYCLNH